MVKTCIKKSLVISLVVILFGCTDQEEEKSRNVDNHVNASCIHERDTTVNLGKEIDHLLNKHPDKSGSFVLEDGGSSLVARAWLTEYALESIDIQYFIFSTDNVGLIACDYLVNAADRGVKVRILIDDIMVEAEVEELLTLDQHENISIKIFNPGMNVGKSFFSST